jgi:hypothetical protein
MSCEIDRASAKRDEVLQSEIRRTREANVDVRRREGVAAACSATGSQWRAAPVTIAAGVPFDFIRTACDRAAEPPPRNDT